MQAAALQIDCQRGQTRLRHGRDTRAEIVRVASQLLQQRGFNAFSYQHIASQLGIRNAAIHYHFPGKVDLGLALIERFVAGFEQWAQSAAVTQAGSGRELVEAWFGWYRAHLTEDSMICVLGMLGAEYAGLPEPMQAAVTSACERLHNWLQSVLIAGREDGTLQYLGSAEHKATALAATLQGALKVARMTEHSRFDAVLDLQRLELFSSSHEAVVA